MGNAPSSSDEQHHNRPAIRNIFQGKNALGLSKAELDQRCRPSGLYPSCEWDEKTIRKLIGDGKIAARLEGTEEVKNTTDEECPICFLNYSETNVTACCQANICTECFLQVKPQRGGKPGNCPFCNATRMRVLVAKHAPKTPPKEVPPKVQTPERQPKDQSEETPEQPEFSPGGVVTDGSSIGSGGFGSSLEQHVKSRPNVTSNDSLLALTPDERKELETQVRAQHYHPLTMRLQQEEAERRMRNEMEYYTSHAATAPRSSRSRYIISEEQQLAMAIEASLRESSLE